jgi:hypothetical protein
MPETSDNDCTGSLKLQIYYQDGVSGNIMLTTLLVRQRHLVIAARRNGPDPVCPFSQPIRYSQYEARPISHVPRG